MNFDDFLAFIKYGIVLILVCSGGWIVLHWLYDVTTMENPLTLKETAQNFIDYWVKAFSKIKI